MPDHPLLLLFLSAANWPLYRRLLFVMFADADDLREAIRYWFIPDLYSWLRNRQFEDMWAELRLSAWLTACCACVGAQYWVGDRFLAWWYSAVVCCAPI